jgi:hypothetical protein
VPPLNIKGASRFLRKWPSATLDIEPSEALWPETKGQAESLARVRGHPLHDAGGHGKFQGQLGIGVGLGVRPEKQTVGPRAPRRVSLPMGLAQYSSNVQQRRLTTASQHDHQHTELAGTTAKRPAAPLVRDEKADRWLAGYTRDDLGKPEGGHAERPGRSNSGP